MIKGIGSVADSSFIFCDQQQRAAERRAGSFDPSTVRLLETWYTANVRHPYPDDVTLAALATGGGISVKQARKWLANRRVRTCNTLTYNGSVHPRRLRRLRRQQTEDRAEAAELRQPLHSTPVQTSAARPSTTAGFRVPSGLVRRDGAASFQTSTPFLGGSRFEVDPTVGRDSTRGVRHHPYLCLDRVASAGRSEVRMPMTVMPRAGCFTAAAASGANFASVHQMATAQLNVFNVFNSA